MMRGWMQLRLSRVARNIPGWIFSSSIYVAFRRKKKGALARPRVQEVHKLATGAVPAGLHGLTRNVRSRCDTLHPQLEVVGVGSTFQSSFVVDQAGLKEIPERLIEGL